MRSAAATSMCVFLVLSATILSEARAASGCRDPNIVSTVAGQVGQVAYLDGTGSSARFAYPAGAAVDRAGHLYVSSGSSASSGHAIRKITPSGTVTTLAGDPNQPPGLVDGQGSAARFWDRSPRGSLAVDLSGNIYVADFMAIRKVTPQGWVSTIAGSFALGYRDGPAATALFSRITSIAVDHLGNVYVTDNGTVRRLSPTGLVSTLAGVPWSQVPESADGLGTAARFGFPEGVAVEGTGDVYVADTGNNTIRRIAPSGWVSTIAGTALATGSADGQGSAARFNRPTSLALDSGGALYVVDSSNFTIRRIDDPRGSAVVTTVAGKALAQGYADGTGAAARFGIVRGLAYGRTSAGAGAIYITDNTGQVLRKMGCPPDARLVDGSFERPVLAPRSFQYIPANAGWLFSGAAGVQANGSAWGAATAVDGAQTAFLQNYGARVAQTVELADGSYSVSFHAARRSGQVQPVIVAIDGMPVGTAITPAGNGFQRYSTPWVNLAQGSHTIEFRSVGSGPDNSTFIDGVVLERKPIEPVPTRYGLTFGLSPDPGLPPGMVQMSCHVPGATLDNPHAGQCNPYHGDMSCERALPVLCIDPATGELAASDPIKGSELGYWTGGAEACQAAGFFPSAPGRMAHFHDGGGWRIAGRAASRFVPGQRYWVGIGDQSANCWNK